MPRRQAMQRWKKGDGHGHGRPSSECRTGPIFTVAPHKKRNTDVVPQGDGEPTSHGASTSEWR